MSNLNEQEHQTSGSSGPENKQQENKQSENRMEEPVSQGPRHEAQTSETTEGISTGTGTLSEGQQQTETSSSESGRPVERGKGTRPGARGTAAMDPQTRKEVARKGGLAVSRNRQHMAEIGRKGGQSVSKNREHMAQIGRKGGAASRGHR